MPLQIIYWQTPVIWVDIPPPTSIQIILLLRLIRTSPFFRALSPGKVVIGQSITSLTFHMSRSIYHDLLPSDEIIISLIKHKGNVEHTWNHQNKSLIILWVAFDRDTELIKPKNLAKVLTIKTRLICLSFASNMIGFVNDITTLVRWLLLMLYNWLRIIWSIFRRLALIFWSIPPTNFSVRIWVFYGAKKIYWLHYTPIRDIVYFICLKWIHNSNFCRDLHDGWIF